jgi:hypothetical protein
MHADQAVPPAAGPGQTAPLRAKPAGTSARPAANRAVATFTDLDQDLNLSARAQPEVPDRIRRARRAPGQLPGAAAAAALANRALGPA